MDTHFYMSRPRWIATIVIVATLALFWWSIAVRLAGASDLDALTMRQEALQFTITNLRWQRDELDTEELRLYRSRASQRLLKDPDGLPALVDQLQDMAEDIGVDITISVAEPLPFENMVGVFTRQVTLGFDDAPYDLLESYVDQLERQANRWHFLLGDFHFSNRGAEASVAGKMQMKIWTSTGQPEEEDTLF